jgi:hypothetical protein
MDRYITCFRQHPCSLDLKTLAETMVKLVQRRRKALVEKSPEDSLFNLKPTFNFKFAILNPKSESEMGIFLTPYI